MLPQNQHIPIIPEIHSTDYKDYRSFLDSMDATEQRRLAQAMGIEKEMAELDVSLGVLAKPLSQLTEGQTNSTHSLFEGLSGLAAEVAHNVELIDEVELRSADALETASANTSMASHTTLDSAPTTTSIQTSATKVSVPQSIRQPTQLPLKRDPLISHDQDAQIKKRKTDIGVEHMQMESLDLKTLTELVQSQIGLTDEDAEYESSDLWIELPNTDHILADNVTSLIGSLLQKISQTNVSDQIPFNCLDRIQHLMMKSVKYGAEIEWSGEEIVESSQAFTLSVTVLKSISVLLALFNLKRKEKKLYLDDYLTEALGFLYRFVEDFLTNINTSASMKSHSSLSIIKYIIFQITIYLTSNQINDTLITKLEYMSMAIFFHQADKDFLSFKWYVMSLLTAIFQHSPDQRSFILDEIVTSMDKLPTQKASCRQVALQNGVNVQLVTILILNLFNTLNLQSVSYSNELLLSNKALHVHEKAERIKEDQRFLDISAAVKKDRENLSSSVASSLITKLTTSPSANSKALFELFLQDLLSLVSLPEYPAAETLLFEITKYALYNSENQSVIAETHLMEMIGLIGSKMLMIRGPDDPPQRAIIDMLEANATIFTYLNNSRTDTTNMGSADLFLAKWVDALIADSHAPEVIADDRTMNALNELLIGYYTGKKTSVYGLVGDAKNEAFVKDTYRDILLYSNFISLYQNVLNHLLSSVDHPKVKTRTKALKNLSLIIAQDDRFINVPQVKASLSSRIADSSPLVRHAVLDIFYTCISSKPWMIPDFYQNVVLTNDKAVSVRKKSIDIALRIMEKSDDSEIQIYVFERVFKRLEDDEESVLEHVQQFLLNLFLLKGPIKHSDSDSTRAIKQLCHLLLGLISKSSKNRDLFEVFLADDIIRVTEQNKYFHDQLLSVCSQVVEMMFSLVINGIDTTDQTKVENCLGLLSIFSKSEIPLINQEQLLSLHPYLTNDVSGTSTTYYSLVILRNTLAHTNSLREQFLNSAQSSLLTRLTKFNVKELDEAMASVWALSEMKGDTTKIANAAASCLLLINQPLEKAMRNELIESDPRAVRLLYLLGCFGRYCDLEKNRDVFMRQKKLVLKEKETILSLITKTLLIFTKPKVNRQIRRVAIKNLIQVATTHSKLFMSEQVLKVLDSEFLGDKDDFKVVMIQGLLEFFETEEKDVLRKSRLKKSSSTSIDVHVFHGDSKLFESDGICASLVQRYMTPVLELCLSADTDTSLLAVKYLRFVVNLGFANPRICIPTIIALEASPVSFIRMVGVELHRELHQRHESLIDTSYIHGLKEAVRYRLKMSDDESIHGSGHDFFTRFFSVLDDSKTSRKRLLTQFVKSLSYNGENITLDDVKFLMNYTGFLCPSILECELTSFDEIFILIDGIELGLQSHDTQIKPLLTQVMTDQARQETPDSMTKLGMQATMLLTLHKFINGLRYAYRIGHNVDKTEIKTHVKPKLHERQVIKWPKYKPGFEMLNSGVFEELLREIG